MNRWALHPFVYNIIIGTFFARFSTSMSMPFLAIYLTSIKGISPAITGFIIGISALVGVFSGFIGGHLSDRYGRKVIMISSISVYVIVFCGFAFADSVLAFFIWSALNGASRAFFEPTSRALLAEFTNQENKLFVFNLRYTAINIGVAIGPLVGLKLGGASLLIPFLVTAFIYFLYAISLIVMFMKFKVDIMNRTSVPTTLPDALNVLRKDRIFLFSMIGIICGVIGYSQMTSTLPQYMGSTSAFKDGVELFAYLVVVNAVTVIVLQYPLLNVAKKYSSLTSMILGITFIAMSLIGFGVATESWMLFLMMITFTIGEILIFTITDYFVDEISPSHLKGTYFGAMNFTSIGSVIGPALGGFLLTYYGYMNGGISFIVLSCISFLGVPFLLIAKASRKAANKMKTVQM